MNQRAALDETIKQVETIIVWGDVPLSQADFDLLRHIKEMPVRMSSDFSEAKIGRWLGWVQGVCCAKGWLTLDDCKNINASFRE
ncbi:MAG: hypothetical protein KKH61_21255 [Gammaproteobacteria bacterium]|uniref:Uncharacterized protein n=1 Tax=viral metagenome TaxID=1070528 RepID=A0A6H1Z9R1_9ZZZZ|nr:hypothetical protein [Gammaproteobacteria bacterium]